MLLTTAALLAACGGSGGPDGDDARDDAPAATASPAASPSSTETASATPTAAPSEEPAAVVETRDDGLTGAPVPPPTATSAEFDSSLVNERAGAFPPLDYPAVVPASEATWLDGGDLVLGAVQNGEARAYPIFMLRFHHVANDELGGEPYLVTF